MTSDTYHSPAALVAIAYAAWRTGDHDLRKQAVSDLQREYGIHLRFPRGGRPVVSDRASRGEGGVQC